MSLDVQQQHQQQHQQQQQLQLDGLNHLMEAATALARLTNNSTSSFAGWAATQTSPFAAGVQVQQQQQERQGFLSAATATATTSALDRSSSVVSDEEDSSPKHQTSQPQITKNTHKKKNLKTLKTSSKTLSSSSQAASAAAQQREIFPQRLLAILNDTSLSDIVSWLPHGRSFVIIRPDVFTEHVLPKYLPPVVDVAARSGNNHSSGSATKYPSFTRKLNRWGFRQATRGPDTGAFHHPLFRRDEPHLCLNMVCQRSRDRSTVASSTTTTANTTNPVPTVAGVGVKKGSKGTVKSGKAAVRKPAPQAAAATTTTQPLQPRYAAAPTAIAVTSTSESSSSSVAAAVAAAAATSFYQLAAAAAAASASTNQAASSSAATHADPQASTRLLQAITTDTALLQWSLQQRDEYERLRLAKVLLYQSFLNAQQQQQQQHQQQQNPPAFP